MCLQSFSHRGLVINHVAESSPRCRALYFAFVPDMDDEQFLVLEQETVLEFKQASKAGFGSKTALSPAVRLQGPFLPIAEMAGIDHRLLLRGPCLA